MTREFYYNDAGAQIDKLALVGAGAREGHQAGRAGLAGGRLRRRVHRGHRQGNRRKAADDLDAIRRLAVAYLRKEQDADLQAFGVKFDVYYLESSLLHRRQGRRRR